MRFCSISDCNGLSKSAIYCFFVILRQLAARQCTKFSVVFDTMKKTEKLPNVKPKKINIDEFVKLAKKVKKSFEEEEKYMRKHENRNGSRFTYSN